MPKYKPKAIIITTKIVQTIQQLNPPRRNVSPQVSLLFPKQPVSGSARLRRNRNCFIFNRFWSKIKLFLNYSFAYFFSFWGFLYVYGFSTSFLLTNKSCLLHSISEEGKTCGKTHISLNEIATIFGVFSNRRP